MACAFAGLILTCVLLIYAIPDLQGIWTSEPDSSMGHLSDLPTLSDVLASWPPSCSWPHSTTDSLVFISWLPNHWLNSDLDICLALSQPPADPTQACCFPHKRIADTPQGRGWHFFTATISIIQNICQPGHCSAAGFESIPGSSSTLSFLTEKVRAPVLS